MLLKLNKTSFPITHDDLLTGEEAAGRNGRPAV